MRRENWIFQNQKVLGVGQWCNSYWLTLGKTGRGTQACTNSIALFVPKMPLPGSSHSTFDERHPDPNLLHCGNTATILYPHWDLKNSVESYKYVPIWYWISTAVVLVVQYQYRIHLILPISKCLRVVIGTVEGGFQ